MISQLGFLTYTLIQEGLYWGLYILVKLMLIRDYILIVLL